MPDGTEGIRELQEEAPLEPAIEVPADEPTEPSKDEAPESVRDTVIKAFNEEKAKLDGDEAKTPEQAEKPVQQPQVNKRKSKTQDGQADAPTNTPPPVRLNAEQKELFNALPPKLKIGVARMFLQHEGEFTRTQKALTEQFQEIRSVHEAISPYVTKWGERGFTPSSAIAALAAAQEKLTDPKTSRQTWINIGKDLGHDVSALEGGETQTAAVPDISQHPQFLALQEQLKGVSSTVSQWQSQQTNSTVDRIVTDMATVRDEKDQFGRYRYPKLHDESFLEQAKPLVSALVGTIPGLSYGEALKRAYFSLEGYNGNSAELNQTKLPTENRAAQAAVSVRGRSSSGATGFAVPEASKIPNSVNDTVRMAYETLRRGV